ncbi:DUF7657 domain-containing protein [Vibrio rotiferianus]|uniref:DUF7657 domain-containing protein n=1 Tax=Vibrio rotiferianus TaxID=190895 RepID=UPI00406A5A63
MKSLRRLALDKFDWFCVALLIPITVFAITPSSYGIVLELFGYKGEGLLWASPRMIRSDEWVVWTPYMQMAVLNGFERFNELSVYHQDLRGFNALPLWDWALVFKPLMWPFWIFEPARAFALHHGLIIVAFLLGWKRLASKCLEDFVDDTKARGIYSALFALTLFFTGFVQFWWTTLGPVLALSSWLLLVVLEWKHSVYHYFKLTFVAVVWLLSHTYPPVIISVAYFGVLLLFIHQSDWWKRSLPQLCFTAIACLFAVAITLFYYKDIIPAMMGTVYPGQRVSVGGQSEWLLWLSTIVPFLTHSNFDNLIGLNICEVGAIASLLPVATAFFVTPDTTKPLVKRALACSLILFGVATAWMLLPVPSFLAKIMLLDQIPSNRMVFLSGLVINYLSLVVLVTGTIRLTPLRVLLFLSFFVFSVSLPSILSLIPWGKKSLFELSALLVLGIWCFFAFKKGALSHQKGALAILLIALLPNALSYSWFNPAQTAFPIFELHNKPEVKSLASTAYPIERITGAVEHDDGAHSSNKRDKWVVSRDYPGAILSGLGMNSFTTVLIQPKIPFFAKMYPELSDEALNVTFNRYAHIMLSNSVDVPEATSPDVVTVPIVDVLPSKSYLNAHEELKFVDLTYETGQSAQFSSTSSRSGSIDVVSLKENEMLIQGWAPSERIDLIGQFDKDDILFARSVFRPDVARALNDKRLAYSGFEIYVQNIDKYLSKLDNSGLCIVSKSSLFGDVVLNIGQGLGRYQCKF